MTGRSKPSFGRTWSCDVSRRRRRRRRSSLRFSGGFFIVDIISPLRIDLSSRRRLRDPPADDDGRRRRRRAAVERERRGPVVPRHDAQDRSDRRAGRRRRLDTPTPRPVGPTRWGAVFPLPPILLQGRIVDARLGGFDDRIPRRRCLLVHRVVQASRRRAGRHPNGDAAQGVG